MKRGDIILNKWAGHIDVRYFIYLGTDGNYIKGIEYIKGTWRRINYYKNDVKNQLMSNGERAYEVVGHTNFLDIAKTDLKKFKDIDQIKSNCKN